MVGIRVGVGLGIGFTGLGVEVGIGFTGLGGITEAGVGGSVETGWQAPSSQLRIKILMKTGIEAEKIRTAYPPFLVLVS